MKCVNDFSASFSLNDRPASSRVNRPPAYRFFSLSLSFLDIWMVDCLKKWISWSGKREIEKKKKTGEASCQPQPERSLVVVVLMLEINKPSFVFAVVVVAPFAGPERASIYPGTPCVVAPKRIVFYPSIPINSFFFLLFVCFTCLCVRACVFVCFFSSSSSYSHFCLSKSFSSNSYIQ